MQHRVVWHEGLFLQAHHLQQQERFLQGYAWDLAAHAQEVVYGFMTLEFDEGQLGLSAIALRQASGFMRDGLYFGLSPQSAPSPVLRVGPDSAGQTVCLCVARALEGSTEVAAAGMSHAEHFRYRAINQEIVDNVTESSERITAQLAIPNLQLKFGKDVPDSDICLPVARVQEVSADGNVSLDAMFVPPILRLGASPVLMSYLSQIGQLVANRAKALATRLSQPNKYGAGEIQDLLCLQLLNRHVNLLDHLRRDASLSPLAFYRLLLQLSGELATYMAETRAPAPLPGNGVAGYNHEDLASSLQPLFATLQAYLTEVLDQSVVELPMQVGNHGYFWAIVEDGNLWASATFVLAVRADIDSDQLTGYFPQTMKIGRQDDIQKMVQLRLGGVQMKYLPIAPARLPLQPGYHFFELTMTDQERNHLAPGRAFYFHVSYPWPGLDMKMWAIKK